MCAGSPQPDKKVVWIIARQHPGEAMAEWFMEGLLEELTDPHNPFATRALKHAVFYIVPNINPDGAVRGHLRTNAAGANLNREWADPSLAHSPEVRFHLWRFSVLSFGSKVKGSGFEPMASMYCTEELHSSSILNEGANSHDLSLRAWHVQASLHWNLACLP